MLLKMYAMRAPPYSSVIIRLSLPRPSIAGGGHTHAHTRTDEVWARRNSTCSRAAQTSDAAYRLRTTWRTWTAATAAALPGHCGAGPTLPLLTTASPSAESPIIRTQTRTRTGKRQRTSQAAVNQTFLGWQATRRGHPRVWCDTQQYLRVH